MSQLLQQALPPATLTPLQRLEALCDPGSLRLLRTGALSRGMGERAAAGDGVLAAAAMVGHRHVFCFAQDASYAGGSLGEAQAETIVGLHRLAEKARAPVVGFVDSAGARMQEGLAALGGYGRLFQKQVSLSGVVPQISIVCGASAGGGCYSPALTDFVIMTERASMFLTGPGIVRQVTGETVDAATLGGPRIHTRNGVCHALARNDEHAAALARQLLEHLPQHSNAPPPSAPAASAPDVVPDEHVPSDPRQVYDVKTVVAALVDEGRTIEISARYARNIVCLFARVEGHSVGIVANQPRHLGGVIDSAASQKAARFIRTCNAFGVPLVALVDTPGFLPGARQEREGVIRHGAKLVYAFAESTVPRVTVVLRKAYGGAAIAMNSKQLGSDYVYAWPGAELGVMAAKQAAEVIHRRDIAASRDPAAAATRFAERYSSEQLTVANAASQGFVDEVIDPAQTRERIAAAIASLTESGRPRAGAGNIQL